MRDGIWALDAVLHERLERSARAQDRSPGRWLAGALAAMDDIHGRRDFHLSTMGPDYCDNFEVIDAPGGVHLPLRATLAGDDRIVHVREMPLADAVTYAHYHYDEEEWAGEDGDEHGLWRRPVVMAEGLVLPDAACAALAGRTVGEVVRTGVDVLDGAVVAWAAVEPPEVAAKLLHGRRSSQPTPASLVLRLEEPARVPVEPRWTA